MNLSAHKTNHLSNAEPELLLFLAAHTWQSVLMIIIILSSAAFNKTGPFRHYKQPNVQTRVA